jgi:DHA1 family bicyclomycin/chloramphenicol resistance-like MFS transporter
MGSNFCASFIFNNIYGYCLSRFSKNAGVAIGLTGSTYMVSSIFSYGFVNLYAVKSQLLLGFVNISLIMLICLIFIAFNRIKLLNLAITATK